MMKFARKTWKVMAGRFVIGIFIVASFMSLVAHRIEACSTHIVESGK